MIKNFLSENFRLNGEQIFEGLLAEERQNLLSSGVTHRYKTGEIVFRENGIPGGIFYIRSGMVKKYKTTPNGSEQIIYICGKEELLGYHALLAEEHYPDSASVLIESEITFIPKEAFLKVVQTSPIFSNRLLKALGHEFRLYVNNITNLATKTVRERLAIHLLILDEKFRANGTLGGQVNIVLSRADLANIVGTAKENLVRLLHDFEIAGLIEKTSKSIRVTSRRGVIKEAKLMGLGPDKANA